MIMSLGEEYTGSYVKRVGGSGGMKNLRFFSPSRLFLMQYTCNHT